MKINDVNRVPPQKIVRQYFVHATNINPRATVIPLRTRIQSVTAALIRGRNEAIRAATSLNMANKLLQSGLIGRRLDCAVRLSHFEAGRMPY